MRTCLKANGAISFVKMSATTSKTEMRKTGIVMDKGKRSTLKGCAIEISMRHVCVSVCTAKRYTSDREKNIIGLQTWRDRKRTIIGDSFAIRLLPSAESL